jgi:thymidylate kinase
MCIRRGRLICFSGVDGTGKTTLAKRLAAALSESGQPHAYVYARYQPFLARPVWAVMKRFFFPRVDPKQDWQGYESRKRARLKHPLIEFLHVSLILIDYVLQLAPRVTIPILLGRRVVCDRYVQDTVISDLAPDLGFSDAKIRRVIRLFFLFLPMPALLFLMDASEDVSLARKTDIPAREYLSERRRIYLLLRDEANTVTLDGGRPLEENWSAAAAAVRARFGDTS